MKIYLSDLNNERKNKNQRKEKEIVSNVDNSLSRSKKYLSDPGFNYKLQINEYNNTSKEMTSNEKKEKILTMKTLDS